MSPWDQAHDSMWSSVLNDKIKLSIKKKLKSFQREVHGLPIYSMRFDNPKRSRLSSLPNKEDLSYKESQYHNIDHGVIHKPSSSKAQTMVYSAKAS